MLTLCADTGGTFTDLATDDGGRAKVPSDGRLRLGVVVEDGYLRLAQALLPARASLAGFGATLLPSGLQTRVLHHAHGSERLHLQVAAPAGTTVVELSTGEEAPVVGARLLTGTPADAPLPPLLLRLATTRGTNALLEGRTPPLLLVTSAGFEDLLHIGTQQRPALFDPWAPVPPPPYAAVVGVRGRLSAGGEELEPLACDAVFRTAVARVRAAGVIDAVVGLLHAHASDRHERAVEEVLRSTGFERVTLSSSIPLPRLLARTETALVDARVTPVLAAFLRSVAERLGARATLRVLRSDGSLADPARYRGCEALLSGPAAGALGAAAVGRACGHPRLLTLDMGGTSADVARIEGEPRLAAEHGVAGAKLLAPAVAVESVAAGGGSVCRWRNGAAEVGPDSAGASPGPACYGRGGPLTLTDVNLLLGRLRPELFALPCDVRAAEAALEAALVKARSECAIGREELLRRFMEVADERMAAALRRASIREGHEPSTHALLVFGGSGGLHGCALAERLGISTVLAPADAGLLSARGLFLAREAASASRTLHLGLDAADAGAVLKATAHDVSFEAAHALRASGTEPAEIRQMCRLRSVGREHTFTVPLGSPQVLRGAFASEHHRVFGFQEQEWKIEVVTVEAIAYGPAGLDTSEVFPDAPWTTLTGIVDRALLRPGSRVRGRAVVQDRFATVFVAPGWEAVAGSRGTLRLKRQRTATTAPNSTEARRQRLLAVAEEMGARLQATALSVNVRERLDFSCAVLDATGRLAANAPHIPVHLGALGVCVRSLESAVRPGKGDVVVTNHPAFGGSHLPDVTVAMPVHAGGHRVAWVANRAHHAEIGGTVPGSLPVDARHLAEEGVILPPLRIVEAGRSRFDAVARLLRAGPRPSRRPEDNLADLGAQVAALHAGAEALLSFHQAVGDAVFAETFEELRIHARTLLEARLARRGGLRGEAEQEFDDGTRVRVQVAAQAGRLRIDFTGTSGTHPGNLNAGPGIVTSAVLYSVRVWLAEDLPLTEAWMDCIDLTVPDGLLRPSFAGPPESWPAVMGGNVETSQRLVDALLEALGVCAPSQGTMNNVVFGDAHTSFYETLGGGGGACATAPGASARHVHMTNTALTDVELLEMRYPARIARLSVRHGSGGAGRHRGGDGLVREYQFLAPLELSLLGLGRRLGGRGVRGGGAGAPGRFLLYRADGSVENLPWSASRHVGPGDRLVVETPGGGAWGDSAEATRY